ncbi:nitrite reductase small subunit NirD [Microbacterium sp. MYb64]|uniref:nitrite reductase small subunit NirD n=1 Tax=Microbacterium sp. MYb64 TaxID=1848691 RepID=UPI000CFC89A8|nr:nitrite reductase small subunit NirD [Microbacterium sp. MYb64]PRB00265.1 nitrite reductase (NAD(P)H) small subunit [Microbacterium sp. MYb64]
MTITQTLPRPALADPALAGSALASRALPLAGPVLHGAAGERSGWERVCRVDDLEPSWGEAVLIRMRQVALFLLSPRELYAVEHEDPAGGAPVMARGIVGSRGDRPTIASPLHKEVYDLGTGECFTDPALLLRTFRTRIVGGFIEIEFDD